MTETPSDRTPEPEHRTYVCGFHPEAGPQGTWCPRCVHEHETRRKAAEMTGDERAAELEALCGRPLSRPFDLIHRRIEELVGRPVWTHEIGLLMPQLIEQARNRPRGEPLQPAEMREIVGALEATGKPVILVSVPEPPAAE